MVALHIRLVARVVATAASDDATEETFEVGRHLHRFGQNAILVDVLSACKLARSLCTDGEHQRLVGACAQTQLLIVEPIASGEEIVVVVVVVFQPVAVGQSLVAYFATNLHPSVGVGNVLVVHKPSPDACAGACVATHHQVAARKVGTRQVGLARLCAHGGK